MPRDLDSLFTPEDRAWLAEMDRAVAPRHVVAAEQYVAAVEARDYITRQNYRLRQHVLRVKRLHGETRHAMRNWRYAALCLGVLAGVLIAVVGLMAEGQG